MLERLFHLAEHKTTVRREVTGGVATFAAMAAVLVVNPAILASTGMDRGAVVTATGLSAALATVLMALATNYPIVLGPAGGINAYFAYTICGAMGVPWQAALGLCFYSGILFFVMSVSGLRKKILVAIPLEMKLAITCGVGLFILMIGLKSAGLVVANPATLVTMGSLSKPEAVLALLGVIATTAMVWRKIGGAIIFGMLGITLLGVVVPNNEATGMITTLPTSPVGLPNSLAPVFLQLDLGYFWHHLSQSIGIVVALLFVDLFDNIGTLIGVCNRIGLLDQDGNIPKVGRAFLADAGAAITGSCLGTSTVTCYIESAVGVEEGARTGLMACVSAVCMLLALFLTPLIVAIPAVATSAALIVVGIFMMQGAAEIDLKDFSKAVPAVVTMIMMPLTFSIAEGIGLGLVVYVGFMLATNRGRAVSVIAYILTILFLFQSYFKK